jgi:acyl-CoA synthetase (AMP-forming)/AMP-acid ligase II
VVLKPGQTATGAEIVEYLKTQIADFKVPQFVVISEQMLPRNPNGKVIKKRIREGVTWGKALW